MGSERKLGSDEEGDKVSDGGGGGDGGGWVRMEKEEVANKEKELSRKGLRKKRERERLYSI